MIQKCVLKKCALLDETRFAPYKDYTVFIIDGIYLIFEDEIIQDFDIDYYKDVFEIIETVDD